MVAALTAVEIFCSYAHEDKAWRQKLETHLSLLRRQGLVSLWHDRLIPPGTDWAHAIDSHLETASIILLLVSADFLASDYCYSVEMERAIARQEAGEARVVPILVRPADLTGVPFAHLQALPTDARPLSTWPDEDAALTNVVASIRRVLEDLPLLAASAPRAALPAIWNIPYPRNPFFLGRESELAQVRQRLQAGQATALAQPQAISGLGGIGKTQLAVEYAYRYHQDYHMVLWGRAESTEALVSSYIELASLLGLPEREANEQKVTIEAVKTWLQTHRSWLLILDNADELALLADFLPPSLGGHLLLTTRASAAGRLAHRFEIQTLLPEQGALFLLRRAGFTAPDAELSHASPKERELAVQVTLELGGLPLALDQAGAYLEETGMDLATYWSLYQRYRTALLKARGGLVADHPEPVAATWSMSFQKVAEKQPAAADLLRVCSYLLPDAIPEEILTMGASFLGPALSLAASDAFQFSRAVEALRAYSLVQRNPQEKTLSVHRLVQSVLQDGMEEAERSLWVKRAILAVNAAFPHVGYGTWSQCERLLPQAMLATQHIERQQVSDREAGRLLYETAVYLRRRARHQEAESLYERALHIQEQQLGPEHPNVARTLNSLAYLYMKEGKYAEAATLYERALHIQEQQLGPEHPSVAGTLNGLGLLYTEQGKYAEAEPILQRALRIQEQQLGAEHLNVSSTLDGLANLYSGQGKDAEAETLYQRALRIREQQLGPDHPNVASLLNNLAGLYASQGKDAEAETLYLRALRIWEQQLGVEHLNVAYPVTGLANLYTRQRKYPEAEPLYQRALRIREQALGLHHPHTAKTLYDLAQFREAQGNNDEARTCYARVLAVREQTLGMQHPKTRKTRKHLIALHRSMGQQEEAARLEATQSEP